MSRHVLSVLLAASLLGLVSCAEVAAPPQPPNTVAPPTSAGSPPQATGRELPRFAPSVADPKDAGDIGGCALLTSVQLEELTLLPETARPRDVGAARACSWTYQGGRNSAGLQIAVERTIPGLDGIYVQRVGFDRFEPVTVSGHPGFRADKLDGDCVLYIAIADYQLFSVDGNLLNEPLPDPCAPSRRMAEMILSNLPPLAD